MYWLVGCPIGSFPACIGFIGFVIILQSGVPFTQVGTGPVAKFIVISDRLDVFKPTGESTTALRV
jgi:hypothetical protein